MNCGSCEKLKEETQRREAAESEVLRISIDLHDDICQRLAGISMFCKSLIPSASPQPSPPELSQLPELSRLIDESLALIRLYARNSFPAELEGGLENALSNLCRTVTEQSGLPCVFSWQSPPLPSPDQFNPAIFSPAQFSPSQEINLYRITQEAVQNAIKHSGATQIKVEARVNDGSFTLTVSDNGSGTAHPVEGMGLRSMRHRAEQLGAGFRFDSSEEGGTRMEVVVGSG
jgi:signal transduction histidine kinase